MLHGMRMWPQMVDQMFWPFAIKVAAEIMNSHHIDTEGHTLKSKFYGVNIENIPVKTFHTLFCLCYIFDSRLHNTGSIQPPKIHFEISHLCISWTLSVPNMAEECCTCQQTIHWTCQPTVPCCI